MTPPLGLGGGPGRGVDIGVKERFEDGLGRLLLLYIVFVVLYIKISIIWLFSYKIDYNILSYIW